MFISERFQWSGTVNIQGKALQPQNWQFEIMTRVQGMHRSNWKSWPKKKLLINKFFTLKHRIKKKSWKLFWNRFRAPTFFPFVVLAFSTTLYPPPTYPSYGHRPSRQLGLGKSKNRLECREIANSAIGWETGRHAEKWWAGGSWRERGNDFGVIFMFLDSLKGRILEVI